MVINDIEVDVKVKCVEQHITQAQLAEKVGTTAPYVNKLIRNNSKLVNNTFVKMLEKLGYDIQLTYVKRENK